MHGNTWLMWQPQGMIAGRPAAPKPTAVNREFPDKQQVMPSLPHAHHCSLIFPVSNQWHLICSHSKPMHWTPDLLSMSLTASSASLVSSYWMKAAARSSTGVGYVTRAIFTVAWAPRGECMDERLAGLSRGRGVRAHGQAGAVCEVASVRHLMAQRARCRGDSDSDSVSSGARATPAGRWASLTHAGRALHVTCAC